MAAHHREGKDAAFYGTFILADIFLRQLVKVDETVMPPVCVVL